MGNLLDKPMTEKETHAGETSDLQFGLSSMQGWRVHMEDAHIAETNLSAISVQQDGSTTHLKLPGHCLFAVFDGHGGTFAAQYSGLNLVRLLSKQTYFAKYAVALQEMQDKKFSDSSEKSAYMGEKLLPLLEIAFQQAFVNLDFEIGVAIVGKPVKDAVLPPRGDSGGHVENEQDSEGNTLEEHSIEKPLEAMNGAEKDDSGTTACCVLVTPDLVLCANAGDSRSIFYKQTDGAGGGNTVLPLSFDHKPDNAEEELRIRKAGGYVTGGRVQGDLAVSRGLGDFHFKHWPTVIADRNIETSLDSMEDDAEKLESPLMHPGDQKVSPIPEFQWYARDLEADKFLVVACDGIWDVRSNLQCAQVVETMFSEGESNMGLVCEEILDFCLWLGSKDNMTALVVKFPAQEVGTGGGVLARRKAREAPKEEEVEAES